MAADHSHSPQESEAGDAQRFRFSLRAFLIVIFVCCILFAIFAEGYWRRSRLKGHLDAIAESGAVHNLMINREEWNASNLDKFYSRFFSLPVNMTEAEFVYTSEGGERFGDETLLHALALPKLRWLELTGDCSVTDQGLAKIADVNPPFLTLVDLRGTKATDAGFISLVDVENLTDIWIGEHAKITDKGIETFHKLRGPYLGLPAVRIHHSGSPRDWNKRIEALAIDSQTPPQERRRMSGEESNLLQYLEELGTSENLDGLATRYRQRQERPKRNTEFVDFLLDYQPFIMIAVPLLICVALWWIGPKLERRWRERVLNGGT